MGELCGARWTTGASSSSSCDGVHKLWRLGSGYGFLWSRLRPRRLSLLVDGCRPTRRSSPGPWSGRSTMSRGRREAFMEVIAEGRVVGANGFSGPSVVGRPVTGNSDDSDAKFRQVLVIQVLGGIRAPSLTSSRRSSCQWSKCIPDRQRVQGSLMSMGGDAPAAALFVPNATNCYWSERSSFSNWSEGPDARRRFRP